MLEGCFKVADLSTFPDAPEVEETGVTFGENSTLKAVAISKVSKSLVLADDSGLEVDALQGSPGVYSARFAGPDADDPANNQKLLTELTDVPMEQRTARFRCVMVVARSGVVLGEFEGSVEGRILEESRGGRGLWLRSALCPGGPCAVIRGARPRYQERAQPPGASHERSGRMVASHGLKHVHAGRAFMVAQRRPTAPTSTAPDLTNAIDSLARECQNAGHLLFP